jgi:nuclear transcription factor Y gamma
MPKSTLSPEFMFIDDLERFKDQKLPLARIKKIMKSDEDVRMISAEAPILFAKACEMFIIEMTHKAYYYAAKNNRKTLQRNDISAAIVDTEIYDFLLDTIPNEHVPKEVKETKMVSHVDNLMV